MKARPSKAMISKERMRRLKAKEIAMRKQEQMGPEIKIPGYYFFNNDYYTSYLVKVPELKSKEQALMIEVGTDKVEYVDSIGSGEFIGPLPICA